LGRRRRGTVINGWLIIDKPLGLTSTQVIGRVRRLTDVRKIGHGGTLDPLATGILPLALGEATKVLPYVVDSTKVYDFVVRWGEATETDDSEGAVIERSSVRPSAADICAALSGFEGDIEQVPPAYSAIKVDGARAYDLARQGETVELKARTVTVHALEMLTSEIVAGHTIGSDETGFRMTCGKGTYVRSLARDLAKALGTCGHVVALRRSRVGPFDDTTSISLDKLEELVHSAPPEKAVLPVETALDDIPALAITGGEAQRLRQGQAIQVPNKREGVVCVMADDILIALGNLEHGCLTPLRVFNL
jgi:tRNA pseudouridine55 synthase